MDFEYLLFLQNLRAEAPNFINSLLLFISEFAAGSLPVVIIVVFYWCIDKRTGQRMGLCFAGATMVTQLIKNIACVYRPWKQDARLQIAPEAAPTATGYSFPSGHATLAASFYGNIAAYLKKYSKWWMLPCVLLTLLTAFARNWLGAHTPQDVLVGMMIALVVLLLSKYLLNWADGGKNRDWLLATIGIILSAAMLIYTSVKPYPLDVLVAESQGMIGYMLAQSLSAQPQMPPVTTVLTRIEVSPDDPAFLQPEKFIGPVYQPEEQEALEAAYGWQMKRDGKYLRRVVASPQPRKILDSEAIELLLKEGHVVICSGGGGVPVTEDGAGSEAVIDKDLAAALLAEQINADGLVILTDADAVYENWGTPQQRAIRHATPDELAPFAKADGSMGPKVTAVSGYVRSRGKPAWIGALSRIEETLAGEAGTCISL